MNVIIRLLIRYRAHKLFGWPSWNMAAYGVVQKKYMGRIAQHIGHVCEK